MNRAERLNRRSFIASASSALAGASISDRVGAASRPRRPVFGVNCYDLFLDGLTPGGSFGIAKIETLARRSIPFIRFPISPQWAGGWKTYDRSADDYWAGLTTLFAAAEHNGVKLVPCLFWYPPALAFHKGEHLDAWGDAKSRTRVFFSTFTAEAVRRFDASPSLLMWEFANELNDWIDLPNVLRFWPKSDPTLPKRALTENDRLSRDALLDVAQSFARTVRKQSRKPISTGWNVPRMNAWNLSQGRWDNDTVEQFKANLRRITPSQFDVLSMHLYPDASQKRRPVFDSDSDLLSAFTTTAAMDRRKSFVGEFGVPKKDDRMAERKEFNKMMDALANSSIDYAAIWDYDRRVVDQKWNVTFDNDRAYQLDALFSANR